MCVCSGTALLRVCSVLCHLSTPTGCTQAAFQNSARPDSWSRETMRFWDNYRIKCDSSLWKPAWSGVNMECFILKLTECFNAVSESNFLSPSICSVLNCCFVLCHLAKTEFLCICCRGLWITRAATEWKHNAAAVSGNTQILSRIETYQLRCCSGAETDRTRIWWNLGVPVPWEKRHWASLPAVGAPPGRHRWEWPPAAGRARFAAWRPRSQQWRRWQCRNKMSQTGRGSSRLSLDAGSHKLCRKMSGYIFWWCYIRHVSYRFRKLQPNMLRDTSRQ